MQYPTIAQPQYGFAPTMPMMPSMSDMPPGMMNPNMSGMMGQNMPQMNFKKGGIASLPDMAEAVENAGRKGDTMLAHINPEEAGILQLLGGSGTINPKTGLPEFFLKKLFSSSIFRMIAPMLPFLIPGVGTAITALGAKAGLGALASKAIASGVVSGFTGPKGGFDPKRALIGGATAFAGGKLMEGLGTPPVGDASSAVSGGAELATGDPYIFGSEAGDFAQVASAPPSVAPSMVSALNANQVSALDPSAPSGIDSLRVDEMASQGGSGVSNVNPAPGGPPAEIVSAAPGGVPTPSYEGMTTEQMTAARTAENARLPEALVDVVGEAGKAGFDLALKNPKETLFLGSQAVAFTEAQKEKEAAEKVLREQEQHSAEQVAFAQDIMRKYSPDYRRLTAEDVKSQNLAGGGLAGLNAFKAGGSPRFLKGGGDGMSDDIPAMIGKKQKAALSDGEFVIPADVVSHLGNGSSRAGAKKLYLMMDNIRQARTGKKRQAPEVKSDRYMPV